MKVHANLSCEHQRYPNTYLWMKSYRTAQQSQTIFWVKFTIITSVNYLFHRNQLIITFECYHKNYTNIACIFHRCCINITQISHKYHTNIAEISHKYHTNITQIFHKCNTNIHIAQCLLFNCYSQSKVTLLA